MAKTANVISPAQTLLTLPGHLESQQGFAEVVASLQAGHGATLDGVWGSSCALAAAALQKHAPATLVAVLPRPADIDDFCDDWANFSPLRAERLPSWESAPSERKADDEVYGDRLRILKLLCGSEKPPLVVTCIQALLQPVADRQQLIQRTRRLDRGSKVDSRSLVRWLSESGFASTSAVQMPGEFSLRGGILDIFAPDWLDPVRVEFFGDEIESLRGFEVSSQRSLQLLDGVEITVLDAAMSERSHLAEHLPARSWFMLVEPGEVQEEARHYLQRQEKPADYHSLDETFQRMFSFPSVTASAVASGSMEATCNLRIESVERFSGDINKVRDELDTAAQGQQVFIICSTEAEQQRLGEIFNASKLAAEGKLQLSLGRLQAGFRLVSHRIVLISGGELFHRSDLNRPAARRRLGRVIDSFLELREGDYVVHLTHGIGRYRGMKLLEKADQVEEHLELEFNGGTKIFVPATNIELVQKYVGGVKSRPTLAKIGGKSWVRQKQATQQAVVDLAAEMLQLQAVRAARPGIAFPPDSHWQKEFDAAFPYNETADQVSAIAALKTDMQLAKPMDRLLCGDVGFGKTECAIRAAFKAVDSGYQVAVLVPTTILAEQHRRTFTARMAEFPFNIRALSRFCTAREAKKILAGLKDGSVDIVIGTHRVAQNDVEFQNLGLLVIDEEQRFGVEIKEKIKALRTAVDVLTMTATPIPRTLHFSLLGIRDISNLETPPEERLAVETRVTRFSPELIRHAVLRELNRGGQIFFVHNRINDIQAVANNLQRIVPEASLVIGHGQMPEGQLEQVMLDFIDHKFDILLATTIIESGLDIPNANTIFIDEADRYGLADLHQLRGRVGRYKHRAYCYLLIDEQKHLSNVAAKRLRAIEEFSDMGAGFAISMRDLEIRGAGNILGTQQSGHIAMVGYELYCEMLEQAVRKLKKMPPRVQLDVHLDLPGEAHIPRSYVSDMRLKIDLYRRLARVSNDNELRDLTGEMVDRFGAYPAPVSRLVELADVRIAAAAWQIGAINLENDFAVLHYTNRQRIEQLVQKSRKRLRIVDDRSAYLPLVKPTPAADALLSMIKSLLRPF